MVSSKCQSMEICRLSGEWKVVSSNPESPNYLQCPGPHLQPGRWQLDPRGSWGTRSKEFKESWGNFQGRLRPAEDTPPVQRLERKEREGGAGHCSLTWPLASSVFHAYTRSELPRALLLGLGLAGCGES